jgi:hypothetical protein
MDTPRRLINVLGSRVMQQQCSRFRSLIEIDVEEPEAVRVKISG